MIFFRNLSKFFFENFSALPTPWRSTTNPLEAYHQIPGSYHLLGATTHILGTLPTPWKSTTHPLEAATPLLAATTHPLEATTHFLRAALDSIIF